MFVTAAQLVGLIFWTSIITSIMVVGGGISAVLLYQKIAAQQRQNRVLDRVLDTTMPDPEENMDEMNLMESMIYETPQN